MVLKNQVVTGVIWVTGYSASGKTTVGRKIELKLRSDGLRTIFLDGDDLRAILADRWGYERQDRVELAKVYFRLCSHLAAQGFTIVIAAVAMYDEVRAWVKRNVPNSIEAYLDVPEAVRRKRDDSTKRVYELINDINTLYDAPHNADIIIKNYADVDPDRAAEDITAFFYAEGICRSTDRGKHAHWEAYYIDESAPIEASPFALEVEKNLATACKILEVGCGNGRDAAYLCRGGYRITALDASQSAIEFCKERYHDLPIYFFAGTAAEFSAKTRENFDVIYSRFCIHAMTPEEECDFLIAAHNLLLRSGTMFLECRSINDPLSRKGEVLSPNERIFGHYRRFIILDELTRTLVENGFDIVSMEESNGLAKYRDEDPVMIRAVAQKR